MSEKIMYAFTGMCVPVIIWFLASWADVLCNSIGGSVHAWNLFQILF